MALTSKINEYEKLRQRCEKDFAKKLSASDFFEYNEVLFSAHSCAIEGNSFSVNDTRELKEHGLHLKLHNKTMIDAFEILDHFKAFEFFFDTSINRMKNELEQLQSGIPHTSKIKGKGMTFMF